jgi:hypothetical protein
MYRRRDDAELELVIPLVNKKGEFVGEHAAAATLQTMEHYQVLLGAEVAKIIVQPLRNRGRN